jgi:hypothetical protein
MHYKRKEKKVNPSVLLRTGVYLLMTTVLMLLLLQGDSFAGEKENTLSESIQNEAEDSGKGPLAPFPDMFLENNEYDVGEVYEGAPVSHAFIIKNRGKRDLVIQSVKPG